MLPYFRLCGYRGTSACAGAAGQGDNDSTTTNNSTRTGDLTYCDKVTVVTINKMVLRWSYNPCSTSSTSKFLSPPIIPYMNFWDYYPTSACAGAAVLPPVGGGAAGKGDHNSTTTNGAINTGRSCNSCVPRLSRCTNGILLFCAHGV